MERAHKDSSPISRVKCVVDSCEFWDSEDHCIASTIEVKPPDADDTQETDCATFRPKDGYEKPMRGEDAIKGISGMGRDLDANFGSVDRVRM